MHRTSREVRRHTRRAVDTRRKIERSPPMGSSYSWVRVAFENGRHIVSMFLTLRTPERRVLLEDAVICQPSDVSSAVVSRHIMTY